jgi:Zn-dependent protease
VNGSLKVGSVLGITIRVHVLLLALAGIVVLGSPDALHSALQLGVLFGIILLHELAHCLVALRFGLHVVDITLWPLGGMARMTEMPESSRIEGFVAIAGPLSNFVMAALGVPILIWASVSEAVSPTVGGLALYFVWGNLMLGGFNLLPAFPMDGGRILRAFLGRNGNWVRGTEQAVAIGRAIAVMLALLGVFAMRWLGMQGVLFVLVALFVWWAGRAGAPRGARAPRPRSAGGVPRVRRARDRLEPDPVPHRVRARPRDLARPPARGARRR